MVKSLINWFSMNNYRLLFLNVMIGILCLSWFGNNYLFGAVIGLVISCFYLYIAFMVMRYLFLDGGVNDLKTKDAGTIVYRYSLVKIPFLIAVIVTIFALYLVFTAKEKASLNYIGGSFICFFEVVVLATLATEIDRVKGNVLKVYTN